MRSLTELLSRLAADRSGNIAIMSALLSPLLVMTLGLGVDYSALTLQKRKAQATVDLAAIVAAGRLDDAEENLAAHFQLNNLNLVIQTPQGYLTPAGILISKATEIGSTYDGFVTIERGRYVADPEREVGQRFASGATPYDAVRIYVQEQGDLYFASYFAAIPTVSASGTAATQKYAAFSIGSRLASLDAGLLNALLGGLLGTNLSLKLMDYQGLVDADVNVLSFIDALAVSLDLQALNYNELLATDITYGQFIDALGKTTGLTPAVSATLKKLGQSLGRTAVSFKLQQLLNLETIGQNLVGNSDSLTVEAKVLDLVNAAAVAAGGGKQVAIDLAGTVPGLAAIRLTIAIGEPPVETPALRVGSLGSVVRTAQTRVALDASVNGLSVLAGLKVHVPLYIEVAHAEAKLADIACTGGSPKNANVIIEAVPGVAELALGEVDTSAFQNFSSDPRVTPASIVSSALLKINGMAHVNASNLKKTRLSFSASEITSGKIETASTRDALTSTVTSLLKNLDAEINLVGIPLGTPVAVQTALANTLSGVTAPLDDVLYNTLLLLGVKIGEVDVRVTDVRCKNSVLVQ